MVVLAYGNVLRIVFTFYFVGDVLLEWGKR